jgi:proliferating cell nuclear antigen
VQAAPTPPQVAPLTKFRAVIQGDSKRSGAIFTVTSLRGVIETAAAFNDSVTTLRVTGKGIEIKVLDKARIALMEVELPSSIFLDFAADGEGDVTVDAKSLLTVLRRARNKEAELRFEDGQLIITIGGVRSFRIRTLEASAEKAPEPKVNHAVNAYVDVEAFKEVVVDAKVLKADAVKLVAENGVLLFKGINETKEVEVKLAPCTGTGAGSYSLDYLIKALKAFDDGVVEVKFGNNSTLELSTTFNEGYIKVFVAPRVE